MVRPIRPHSPTADAPEVAVSSNTTKLEDAPTIGDLSTYKRALAIAHSQRLNASWTELATEPWENLAAGPNDPAVQTQ